MSPERPTNLRADQVELWREAHRKGAEAGVAAERGRSSLDSEAEAARLTTLVDRLAGRIARVEALVESWPHGDNGQGYRAAVTQCRAAVLAALADCGHPNDGNPDHDCRPFAQ